MPCAKPKLGQSMRSSRTMSFDGATSSARANRHSTVMVGVWMPLSIWLM
jgi:hypothetical protein